MWPWGHVAVAYLLYAAWCHGRTGRPPAARPTLAVGIGALLPDVVDKPLAWWIPLLPTGRTLAHSLAVAVPILVALWWLLVESRAAVAAFALGWVAHAVGDALPSVVAGELRYARFLFWPVLSTPTCRTQQSFSAHLLAIEPTPAFVFELVLVLLAVLVWRRDGYPGVGVVRSGLGSERSR